MKIKIQIKIEFHCLSSYLNNQKKCKLNNKKVKKNLKMMKKRMIFYNSISQNLILRKINIEILRILKKINNNYNNKQKTINKNNNNWKQIISCKN